MQDLEPGSSPDIALLDMVANNATNQAEPSCALPVFDFTQAVLTSARTNQAIRFE
jgi:hypothetical protein